jgi:hypothetical protein
LLKAQGGCWAAEEAEEVCWGDRGGLLGRQRRFVEQQRRFVGQHRRFVGEAQVCWQ